MPFFSITSIDKFDTSLNAPTCNAFCILTLAFSLPSSMSSSLSLSSLSFFEGDVFPRLFLEEEVFDDLIVAKDDDIRSFDFGDVTRFGVIIRRACGISFASENGCFSYFVLLASSPLYTQLTENCNGDLSGVHTCKSGIEGVRDVIVISHS